jgi:hypothetical protein
VDENNDAYGGSDCSLSPEDLRNRDNLRTSLCAAITNIFSKQGPSAATLQVLSSSLQTAFQSDEVLTEDGINACVGALDIVAKLASSGYLQSLPLSTVNVLTQTLSAFVAKASAISSSLDTSFVTSALEAISSGVLETLVDGEAAQELISDNVQTSLQKARLSDIFDSSLSPPQTLAETSYGSLNPMVIFTDSGLSACQAYGGYLRIAIAKYSKNPNANSTSIKTPVLKFDTFASSSSSLSSSFSSASEDQDYTISSLVSRSQPFDFTPVFFIVLQYSTSQNFSFDTDIFSASYKPSKNTTLPECSIFNGVENVPCSGCNISAYTNFNVTFACHDISLLCDSSVDRRLFSSPVENTYFTAMKQLRVLKSDDADDGGTDNSVHGSQFGAIFAALVAELASVLSSNPFLINAGQAQGIISFVCSLVFIIVFGIFFFTSWDRLDADEFVEMQKLRSKNDVELKNGQKQYDFDFDLHHLFNHRRSKSIIERVNSLLSRKKQAKRASLQPRKISMVQVKDDYVRRRAENQAIAVSFLETIASKRLLKEKHPLIQFWRYIFEIHDFTAMFADPSLQVTRTTRYLDWVRAILIGLFCDTLFFGIFFPDDGSCSLYTDRPSCIATINKATARPQCYWSSTDDSGQVGECQLRAPPSNFVFTIMIALLTVIIGLPIDLLIQYIQYTYCRCRPRLEELDISWLLWLFGLSSSKSIDNLEGMQQETNKLMHLFEQAEQAKLAKINQENRTKQKHPCVDEYFNFLSTEDEVSHIVSRVQAFLAKYLQQGHNSWKVSSCESNTNQSKLTAILQQLQINPDGTSVPLTLTQRFLYGSPLSRLEAKINYSKELADMIVSELEDIAPTHRDRVLLQHFVLEQFPLFKRFCLTQAFFIYHDMPPPTIDPISWLAAWFFVSSSFLFFIYWMFAWGVKNGGSTLSAWGMNFGIGVLQDIFFVQIVKIYLVRYVGVEAAKPQLRSIYRLFNDLIMKYAMEGMPEHHDIRVVQYTSATCRAARSAVATKLVSSRILSSMDDSDALHCEEGASVSIGHVTFLLVVIPALLALVSEVLSELTLETLLPSLFSGFLIANQVLYQTSVIVLIIPYLAVAAFLIWSYVIFHPSKRRVMRLEQIPPNQRARAAWLRYYHSSKQSFWTSYLRLILSRCADMQAYIVYNYLSFHKLSNKQKQAKSRATYWRLMNTSLLVQGRVHKSKSSSDDILSGLSEEVQQEHFIPDLKTPKHTALSFIPADIEAMFVKKKGKKGDITVVTIDNDPFGIITRELHRKKQSKSASGKDKFHELVVHQNYLQSEAAADALQDLKRKNIPEKKKLKLAVLELAQRHLHSTSSIQPEHKPENVELASKQDDESREAAAGVVSWPHALNESFSQPNPSVEVPWKQTKHKSKKQVDSVHVEATPVPLEEINVIMHSPLGKIPSRSIFHLNPDATRRVSKKASSMAIAVYLEEYLNFEQLVLMLRELWENYRPGGQELHVSEKEQIEEEFISWMIKKDNYVSGIRVKEFIAWLHPICKKLAAIKGEKLNFRG